MDSSESIMSYVNRLRELENKLAEIGSHEKDKEKGRALLRGLRDEFNITAEVIRATDKSIPEAISLLVIQEATITKKEDANGNSDSAFIVNKLEKSCYYCNKKEISSTSASTIHNE